MESYRENVQHYLDEEGNDADICDEWMDKVDEYMELVDRTGGDDAWLAVTLYDFLRVTDKD